MTLTYKECELLLGMVKTSIIHATQSGIPIGKEYYKEIDEIKDKIYAEMQEAVKRANGGFEPWS